MIWCANGDENWAFVEVECYKKKKGVEVCCPVASGTRIGSLMIRLSWNWIEKSLQYMPSTSVLNWPVFCGEHWNHRICESWPREIIREITGPFILRTIRGKELMWYYGWVPAGNAYTGYQGSHFLLPCHRGTRPWCKHWSRDRSDLVVRDLLWWVSSPGFWAPVMVLSHG